MRAIHQLVAGFSRGDAISNEAVVLRGIFRQWGFESEIYCERRRILPELRQEARDLDDLPGCCGPDDIVFLHLSIGSRANAVFPTLPGRKVILYHNITPPEYFRFIQPSTAADLARGREQAAALAGEAEVNLADSAYNAGELAGWGYPAPAVLPLVLDFGKLESGVDRATRRRFEDGKTNVLFVGRCAPNKRLEDLVAAFACYQKCVDAESRLILAGSYAGTERYQRLLLSLVRDLKLEHVVFTGAIPQTQLNACYRSAHVFLCMSEHEGFCIPLVEALVHRVPVLAYASSAVPETLGGAGILFRHKAFEAIAELMGRLAREDSLRRAVLAGQDRRLRAFRARDLAAELRGHLGALLGDGPGSAPSR
jgi:glycosyltransferase involved in cell wall biosynthesis